MRSWTAVAHCWHPPHHDEPNCMTRMVPLSSCKARDAPHGLLSRKSGARPPSVAPASGAAPACGQHTTNVSSVTTPNPRKSGRGKPPPAVRASILGEAGGPGVVLWPGSWPDREIFVAGQRGPPCRPSSESLSGPFRRGSRRRGSVRGCLGSRVDGTTVSSVCACTPRGRAAAPDGYRYRLVRPCASV